MSLDARLARSLFPAREEIGQAEAGVDHASNHRCGRLDMDRGGYEQAQPTEPEEHGQHDARRRAPGQLPRRSCRTHGFVRPPEHPRAEEAGADRQRQGDDERRRLTENEGHAKAEPESDDDDRQDEADLGRRRGDAKGREDCPDYAMTKNL